MALPLVKYASRLACRSNSRFDMGLPGLDVGDARADARNIAKDFVDGVEPVIALEYDKSRCLTLEHVAEQIERPVGNRMRMGVRKDRLACGLLSYGHTAR